ncbi:MAG: DUF2520 domain-containing protein, partial [Sphingobacteriales bacterium]
MDVSFIGSGNVATNMAAAFKKAGFNVLQIWSHTPENAAELAGHLNASAISSMKELKAADLYVLSIKDDEIINILPELNIGNGLIVHTSGATGMEVFASSFENYGVLYPLQTFSKERAINMKDVPFCIEANNEENLKTLKAVAKKVSLNVSEINSIERRKLHLAAVFACNFTNHMYALAEELLENEQLDFNLLRPLIKETAEKAMVKLPKNVQTGPA